jgi:RNA polymerase sigma-70 factor (ECF subfamily)
VDLYGPLVYCWCRRCRLPDADVADVFQDIFAAVAAHLDGFRKEAAGDSFRGWLLTITRNKIRDYYRRRHHRPEAVGGSAAQELLHNVPDPGDEPHPQAESEDTEFLRRALELVRGDFEENTWQAFWQVVVEDRSAVEVSTALGVSVNAVYKARARVLARLREELGDLIEH